jgi:hypothetical protein
MLEAKLKIKARGTTFVFGAQQVTIRNWEKKGEEEALSGCYNVASELLAWSTSVAAADHFRCLHARGHAAASADASEAGAGRPEAAPLPISPRAGRHPPLLPFPAAAIEL